MAVVLRGPGGTALAALTAAMLASGHRLTFDGWPTARVDKHSTGGVGDKVALVVGPLVAACGVAVPMMSGRGLGHTGGTLDKLEAIPGFRTGLSLAEAKAQVMKLGCAMIGQTPEIAPADKKLYALRDVTGTVEAIPLIAASIMAKNLAGWLSALVLDVKHGSGACLSPLARALDQAQTSSAIGGGRVGSTGAGDHQAGGAGGHRPRGRGVGGRPHSGGRRRRSQRRVRHHGQAGRPGGGRRADRVRVRARSGRHRAGDGRLAGSDRHRRKTGAEAPAARLPPRDKAGGGRPGPSSPPTPSSP